MVMGKICLNCGQQLDEWDNDACCDEMGCNNCTVFCLNCGWPILDSEVVFVGNKECCVFCEDELSE